MPLADQQLYAGLGRKAEEVSAANVPKMNKLQFGQFQRRNNTDKTEFYNTKWFHYAGGITPLSGKNWFGHEINNYAIGEGFAARGWSIGQMSEAILARRYAMMFGNAIYGRDPGGIMGGEIPWAIVGYSYYEARYGGY